MNPQVKEMWIKALQTGQYAQATGKLHAIEDGQAGFCCLGVLCDLAVREGVINPPKVDDTHYDTIMYYGQEEAHELLPYEVMTWAELDSDNGNFEQSWDDTIVKTITSLVDLNDGGKTFMELAEYIKEYF